MFEHQNLDFSFQNTNCRLISLTTEKSYWHYEIDFYWCLSEAREASTHITLLPCSDFRIGMESWNSLRKREREISRRAGLDWKSFSVLPIGIVFIQTGWAFWELSISERKDWKSCWISKIPETIQLYFWRKNNNQKNWQNENPDRAKIPGISER